MKRIVAALVCIFWGVFSLVTNAQIHAPDGLRIPGGWNSWANSNGMGGVFDCQLITIGTRRWVTTFQYTGATGNQEFKVVSGGSGNPWANQWHLGGVFTVNDVTKDVIQSYSWTTDGGSSNNRISVTNGKYYAFRWRDNGYATTEAIFMEISAEPVSITSVSGNYTSPGTPLTVTATLSAAKSPEEKIFIRYTTNGFSTSSLVEMTCSGTTCTGTIPGGDVGNSTNHRLYVLSTTLSSGSITHSNADMATINLNNNTGSNYQMSVLPITLTHFTGRVKGSSVHLQWRTATELNNDYMAVERSAEGSHWQELGRVSGAGTTTSPQDYAFADEKPLSGHNYYRLRQVDYDGSTAYHKTIVVDFKGNTDANDLQVFPSPAKERLNVVLSVPAAQDSELWLLDVQGRLLQRMVIAKGDTQGAFEVSALPQGVYFVRLAAGDARSFRFVK